MKNLSPSQEKAYNALREHKNVFLSGEGGSGKSYVLKRYIDYVESYTKDKIVVCALSGIAAINVGGSTIHRAFNLGIEPLYADLDIELPSVIHKADIIVIDEISMVRIDLFEYIIKVIRTSEEKRNKKKQLIVVGDFYQLPPIVTEEDKSILANRYGDDVKYGFCFQSPLWNECQFEVHILKEMMRQKEIELIHHLNLVREGNELALRYFNNNCSHELGEHDVVLCARNKEVDQINEEALGRLESEEYIFIASETGIVRPSDKAAPEELHLKEGARVMILINDYETDMYVNGTLGTIKKLTKTNVEIVTDEQKEVIIEDYTWNVLKYELEVDEDGNQKPVKHSIGTYTQLPLKLAYALSIHKSQGQSLQHIMVHPSCWEHGQLYVALSRTTSLEGLHLNGYIRKNYLVCDPKVKEFYDSIEGKK